jgi:hypothetical protein
MIREEIGRIAASGMGPVLLLAALAAEAYAQTAGVVVLDSDIADGFYTRSPPFSASTAWLGLYLGGEEPRIRPVEIDWSSTERDDYTEHRMSTDPETVATSSAERAPTRWAATPVWSSPTDR